MIEGVEQGGDGDRVGQQVGVGVAHEAQLDQRMRCARLGDAPADEVQQRIEIAGHHVGVAEQAPGAVEIPRDVGARGDRQRQVARD